MLWSQQAVSGKKAVILLNADVLEKNNLLDVLSSNHKDSWKVT